LCPLKIWLQKIDHEQLSQDRQCCTGQSQKLSGKGIRLIIRMVKVKNKVIRRQRPPNNETYESVKRQ